MNRKLKLKLEKIYSFMEEAYQANWKIRWGETPYMPSHVSQRELDKFFAKTGKFETVAGHMWAIMLFWASLRRVCQALNRLVDSTQVFEMVCVHDLGEAKKGDVSLVAKIHYGREAGKDIERKDLIEIIDKLPGYVKKDFLTWFDEFEGISSGKHAGLETLVVRWMDSLQGDQFVLSFGDNLPHFSEVIEEIVKIRSAARAKAIIDFLQEKTKTDKKRAPIYKAATQEVEQVMKFHRDMIKKAGIRIDLTGLGF